MIALATEKQKRVTAQTKLRMQKHRAKTKSILETDVANDVAMAKEPNAMELDAVLVNHITTHDGAATLPKAKKDRRYFLFF